MTTPPDDTTLEGVEQFADESREFAEASLPLAAEILPDDTTAPVTAEGLRERIQAVIEDDHEDDDVLAAMIVDRVVDPLMTELTKAREQRDRAVRAWVRNIPAAGDPGDLPARMAEAMRVALVTWSEGAQHEHLANAALSVRDELVAHLAARVGDAERRAEHAESEHQVTQDRLAEARAERDTLKAADKRVRRAIASFEWTVVGKLVSAALDAPETREETDRG